MPLVPMLMHMLAVLQPVIQMNCDFTNHILFDARDPHQSDNPSLSDSIETFLTPSAMMQLHNELIQQTQFIV